MRTPKEEHEQIKTGSDKEGRDDMWGLVLIFAGFILLLNTLGYVDWDIWNVLLKFWPVLLIVSGLEILTAPSRIGRILVGFLTVAILSAVAVVSYASVDAGFARWMKVQIPWLPQQIIQSPFRFPQRNGNL